MAGHLSKTEEHLYNLLSLLPSCLDEEAVDEILYGRAGYLFCLLFVKKHISKQAGERLELEKAARQVFDALVANGKKNSGVKSPNTGRVQQPLWHGIYVVKYPGGVFFFITEEAQRGRVEKFKLVVDPPKMF